MGRLALVLLAASCCGAGSTATPCSEGAASAGGGVAIASPALECRSRICLVRQPDGAAAGICTVECSSDGDCATMDGVYCRTGYACVTVGEFPRRVCACR